MNSLLRPYRKNHLKANWLVLTAAGACLALAPHAARAQAESIIQIFEGPVPLLVHGGSQGYLGVYITDVDSDKAQTLKLKEVRGAVITLIDHDAPAGQIGLKVNDVVIALNGENVEGAEQLRRMLREIPAGRKVSLEISRDGNIQTLAVQLADRKTVDQDVWDKIDNGGTDLTPTPGMGILAGGGGGDAPMPGGFHLPFFGSSLNVGALVEPLTSQMAEYLGVPAGLMVKQVTKKSEAATAGLRAFDVILKVGADSIATSADWDRALRSNQGKPVQVTILRDKKQETLTLQVDSKRHQGEVEFEDLFPSNGDRVVAQADLNALDTDLAQALSAQAQAEAGAASRRAEQLQEQVQKQFGANPLGPGSVSADELRKQAEKLRESLETGTLSNSFQLNSQQMEQLGQQMEELRKSFNPEDFKIDPKQMQQFQELWKDLQDQDWQHRDWQDQGCGHFV